MATLEEHREHGEKMVEIVGASLQEPDSEWLPVGLGFPVEGKAPVLIRIPLESFANDASKDALVDAIRHLIQTEEIRTYLMVQTTWAAWREPGEPWDDPRPSDDPERVETLMITVLTADSGVASLAKIHRHADSPPTLGEWDRFNISDDETELSGRFIEPIVEALQQVQENTE